MSRAWLAALAATTLLAAIGCDDEERLPPATTSAARPQAPVELHDADLAVPADFEEDAAQAISAANYKAIVDELEKEIGAD